MLPGCSNESGRRVRAHAARSEGRGGHEGQSADGFGPFDGFGELTAGKLRAGGLTAGESAHSKGADGGHRPSLHWRQAGRLPAYGGAGGDQGLHYNLPANAP